MNKLNKELLARALVEGVDDSYSGAYIALASESHRYDGFHSLDNDSNDKFFWQYVCTKEEYLAAKAEKEITRTVMDAVNEFKGVYPYSESLYIIHWINTITSAMFTFTSMPNGSEPNSNWQYVCTKEEFNQCTKECEANFGKSITYTEYKKDFKAFSELDLKPAQPVFTQAMADAGELPVVGMNCQGYVLAETKKQGRSCDKWVEGVFIQKSQAPNGGICFLFKCDNGHYYTLNSVSHFKPIDTRTEKEKAIEKAITNLMFYGDQTQTSQKANETLIAIIEGKITGVKWVGK